MSNFHSIYFTRNSPEEFEDSALISFSGPNNSTISYLHFYLFLALIRIPCVITKPKVPNKYDKQNKTWQVPKGSSYDGIAVSPFISTFSTVFIIGANFPLLVKLTQQHFLLLLPLKRTYFISMIYRYLLFMSDLTLI